MILSLTIRQIALIDQLTISFHPGMQVLAGETGAGKSIVVDAVNLALGGRADRGLIRSGCEKASVEAVFQIRGQEQVLRILEREGIDPDGGTVTVYREISQSGRNICRICGILLPVSVLREMSPFLMDIHGQHEHQFLADPEEHLRFLDRMGGEDYRETLRKTAEACEAFLSVHRRYAQLRKEQARKDERIAALESRLEELHAAKLKDGEEELLAAECARLRNAEKIAAALREARAGIAAGETEKSPLEKIRNAWTLVASAEKWGVDVRALSARCESVYYELEEIAYEISALADRNEQDPERLEKAEARLDLIRKLERKYGGSIQEVLSEQTRLEKEYEELCSLDDQVSRIAREHKQLLGEYRELARSLSDARRELAAGFEQKMERELRELGMEKTVFRVRFEEKEGEKRPMPRPIGDDTLEFMISPNPGEPLKPMAEIASGGELSRLMLAIKTLEAANSGVDCMVFDEIDTGISGRMAQVVAEKMLQISRSRQVICVSHLPQIVAAADYQYLVSKKVIDGRTFTAVEELSRAQRRVHLAAMISGAEGSGENAEAYAEALLRAGEQKKAAGGKEIP